jgi:23S rRNA (adenine2503-C2)-methyltransferase
VLDGFRRWHEARRRKVYVEYLMLIGVNDRYEQALQLAALVERRGAFKVNLIPYNPTSSAFASSSRDAIGVPVTVRLTGGATSRPRAASCQ